MPFLKLVVVFLALHAIYFGWCVAEGFTLHWLIPAVDLGVAIVATSMGTFGTMWFIGHALSRAIPALGEIELEDGDDSLDADLSEFGRSVELDILPDRPFASRRRRSRRPRKKGT
jgi:hypothetical protein